MDRNTIQARKASAAATAAVRAYRQAKKAQARKASPTDLLEGVSRAFAQARKLQFNSESTTKEDVIALRKMVSGLLNQAQNLDSSRQQDRGGWVESIQRNLTEAVRTPFGKDPARWAGRIAESLEWTKRAIMHWRSNRLS